MKERGIIMSAPMVRALLDGSKTQTRRIVKLPRAPMHLGQWEPTTHGGAGVFRSDGSTVKEQVAIWHTRNGKHVFCPYGVPGDRLWVRETHCRVHPGMLQHLDPAPDSPHWEIIYRADELGGYLGRYKDAGLIRWTPSIFMPRKHSRITLEITRVRVERLQDIGGEEAWAEGCKRGLPTDNGGYFPAEQLDDPSDPQSLATGWDCAEDWYADLWDSLHGKGAWELNPWVWVLEFRKLQM